MQLATQMNYSKEDYETLKKAGAIARKVKDHARTLVKPGMSLLEVAEKLEHSIRHEGKDAGVEAKPAFPINLSVGNNAAHYTPGADDTAVVGEKDLLKVDIGVRIGGVCSDTAVTLDFSGENGKLVEAAEQALQNALAVMKAGVSTKKIGQEIQQTIEKYGFRPVENLCGHSIEPYVLHAGIEIPNVPFGGYELEEGDVFAVEPFASTGEGHVREDASICEIYSLAEPKPVRMQASRKLIELVAEEYHTLPFAKRWLAEIPGLQLAINDLGKQGVMHGYPLLKERQGVLVSQAETDVIVEKDSVKVIV